MESVNSVCVICNEKTRGMAVIPFTEKTFKKSHEILIIRKKCGLKYKDVVLPININDTEGYHVACYKKYLAVMKKYYEREASTSSDISPFKTDTIKLEPVTSGEDITDRGEEFSHKATTVEESAEIESCATSADETLEEVQSSKEKGKQCYFCQKSYKKHKGRSLSLHTGEKKSLRESLQTYVEFLKDSDIYKKLEIPPNQCHYHNICRVNFFNKLKANTTERPQTSYHVTRDYHKKAFEEICSFLEENVIEKGNCYFLTHVGKYYVAVMNTIAVEHGDEYDIAISVQHLKNKIIAKYKNDIKVMTMHNKNIVMPKNRILDDDLFSLL